MSIATFMKTYGNFRYTFRKYMGHTNLECFQLLKHHSWWVFEKKQRNSRCLLAYSRAAFRSELSCKKGDKNHDLGCFHTHTHTPCNSTCQLWHINRRRICSTAWTVELETYNIDVDLCEDWRWQFKHTFAKGICGISRQPAIAYPVYLVNIYVRIYIYIVNQTETRNAL